MPRTRNPVAVLDYCQRKLATRDGSPPKLSKPRFRDARYPNLEVLLLPAVARGFDLAEAERLRDWLNYLARLDSQRLPEHKGFDAQTAYLALLQVWLKAHGIPWPSKGVFAADLGSPGKGRPLERKNSGQRLRCYNLHNQGQSLEHIVKEVFPEAKTPPQRAAARKKAGTYIRAVKKRKSNRPDMTDLEYLAYELLGLEDPPSFDPF
jgi:hypothetical protein